MLGGGCWVGWGREQAGARACTRPSDHLHTRIHMHTHTVHTATAPCNTHTIHTATAPCKGPPATASPLPVTAGR